MRKSGFYWVKVNNEWEVAEWDGQYWEVIGDECWIKEREFSVIGPRIRPPDEKDPLDPEDPLQPFW